VRVMMTVAVRMFAFVLEGPFFRFSHGAIEVADYHALALQSVNEGVLRLDMVDHVPMRHEISHGGQLLHQAVPDKLRHADGSIHMGMHMPFSSVVGSDNSAHIPFLLCKGSSF